MLCESIGISVCSFKMEIFSQEVAEKFTLFLVFIITDCIMLENLLLYLFYLSPSYHSNFSKNKKGYFD